MTLEREPLSFERALRQMSVVLPYDRMGEIIGKAARTVSDYTHPATPTSITLRDAWALTRAYRLAGGKGDPIVDAWRTRLEIEEGRASESSALIDKTLIVIKEGGEAHLALVAACRPDATELDRANARRELQQSIQAEIDTLAHLNMGAGPDELLERGPGGVG